MRYNLYDSTGTLLRGGFSSKQEARNWAFTRNITRYEIK